MSKERNILWIKCDFMNEDDIEDMNDDEGTDEYQDSYLEERSSPQFKMVGFNIPSVIHTPFGPVNQDDSTSPILDTDFFIGHTNFNLSKKILVEISNVEGVEFLKVMSRYRFIVGTGTMFDSSDVRAGIEVALGVTSISPIIEKETNDSVKLIVDDIISKVPTNEKWLAYIFPNGEHIVKIVKSTEEGDSTRNRFLELERESHGLIVTSED
jgi:hypothetical protein